MDSLTKRALLHTLRSDETLPLQEPDKIVVKERFPFVL